MWNYIHIPKTAGTFLQKELGLALGDGLNWHSHCHHNSKLKEKGVKRTGQFSLSEERDRKELSKILDKTSSNPQVQAMNFASQLAAVTGISGRDTRGLCERYIDKTPYEETFSTIRNPFSWLASYYNHGEDGWEGVNDTHGFRSFKEFVVHYCTCDSPDWHEPCLHRSMAFQLFDENDDIVCKYIIRQERLYEGVEKFLDYKITAQKDAKTWPEYNYKEMYDNEMIDLVSEKMEHELKLFNYDFEGPKNDDVGFVDLKHKYDIITNGHNHQN